MTLNPLDPEGRLLSLAPRPRLVFVVLGPIVTFNAVSFTWRAEPAQVLVIDLKERRAEFHHARARLRSHDTDGPSGCLKRGQVETAPRHRERVPGYFDPETPRIETDATLRTTCSGVPARRVGAALGLFAIFLLRRVVRRADVRAATSAFTQPHRQRDGSGQQKRN